MLSNWRAARSNVRGRLMKFVWALGAAAITLLVGLVTIPTVNTIRVHPAWLENWMIIWMVFVVGCIWVTACITWFGLIWSVVGNRSPA